LHFAEGTLILAVRADVIIAALVVLILAGFGFRATGLSAEGLSEDELNKLNTVADYRANGLTGANGEHPMLMKALQAGSIIAAEKWNSLVGPAEQIAPETALRLPGVIAGALTALLIYLIAAEYVNGGPEGTTLTEGRGTDRIDRLEVSRTASSALATTRAVIAVVPPWCSSR